VPGNEKSLSCVLLADRHHALAEGTRSLLETAFGSVVMVADVASLLEGAARVQPDVVVVDLSLSREGGLEWLGALCHRCPATKVVALSLHDERSVCDAALRAGAHALVLKRNLASDLLPTVARLRGKRDADAAGTEATSGERPKTGGGT
jgi:DNA-binding NarL/FixJ family response regulator